MAIEPKITYLDRNGKKVELDYFFDNLSTFKVNSKRVEGLIKRMDYTGNICLTKEEYSRSKYFFDANHQKMLDGLVVMHNERVYLRGNAYHLHISIGDNVEKIRTQILDNLAEISNLELKLQNAGSGMDLPCSALCSSFLDHLKHYAMCMTFGVYNAMLTDKSIPKEEFDNLCSFCNEAIHNYYSFMLGYDSLRFANVPNDSVAIFKQIELPKDTPDSRQAGSKKLVFRDLDHPGQIMLYAISTIRHDKKKQEIDVVINPLFGSIEVGYALRSICELMDVPKIKGVHFIRYSRYGERHPLDITREPLQKFVPECLVRDFEDAVSNPRSRVVLIDDALFKGQTVSALTTYIDAKYGKKIEFSAVEIDERYINPEDLVIPAIAMRSILPIQKIIKSALGLQ
jgi:adenine/guanine phosphoribosyltransferase-like PRPP-binding protein